MDFEEYKAQQESEKNKASANTPVQDHPQIANEPAPPDIDPMKMQMLLNRLKEDQNLSMGILGGFIAAMAGASVWAIVTALTEYQIGFMAVGVGFIVGYAVRHMGHGVDQIYGIIGAGLALVGCLAGNILTSCIFIAQYEGIPFMDVLTALDFSISMEILAETFSPMDILFYGLAIYYGYKYSFREFTERELQSVAKT